MKCTRKFEKTFCWYHSWALHSVEQMCSLCNVIIPKGCITFRSETFWQWTFRPGHFALTDVLACGHFGLVDVSAWGHFALTDISPWGHFALTDVSAWENFRPGGYFAQVFLHSRNTLAPLMSLSHWLWYRLREHLHFRMRIWRSIRIIYILTWQKFAFKIW